MTDAAAPALVRPRALPRLNLPYLEAIWRVRGEVPVDPALAPEEAFARIAPLLDSPRTAVTAAGGTLSYTKRNPAAQDRLAAFNRGRMWIERAGAGAVLRFDLFSHALLLCFLAPLLFLGFAQAAIALNAWEAAGAEASEKAKDESKDKNKAKPVPKLNPIDEFLGAPVPEDPNKKKDEKKDEGRHSPDEAYALAAIFAVVYLVGRWLEPWLLRRRLRAALAAPPVAP
jgi:hypothetical protein